jgi:non-haem Fe2+, alpha-ketoglutarate-dependent halogenase
MTAKKLSDAQQAFFRANGYLTPIPAIDGDLARELGRKVEQLDPGIVKQKSLHLLLKWVNDVMRTPSILDAVEDVLGPDLLVWSTALFYKRPHDPGFVSWHQDATYWGLQPTDVVTAWVALSPSNRTNGALRLIPGSHLKEQLPHRQTFAENNLLLSGQEIAVEVDESVAAMCELQPGEMSLHHIMAVHGSDPNPSDQSRIGLAIRYIASHVHQTSGFRDTATLVRGENRHNNFELEEAPDADLSFSAREYHRSIVQRTVNNITSMK